MKYLSVLTRCRDEFYIKEWVDYYLSQGIDSIYIIDDDSKDKSIYDFASKKKYKNVHISFEKRIYNIGSKNLSGQSLQPHSPSNLIFKNKIKNKYKWLIYCDVDEFMVTKKNFNLTIKDQLKKIDNDHSDIQVIAVPWVFMSGGNLKNNPKNILTEITYRHDHDKKHPHKSRRFRCRHEYIECKSILKPQFFNYLLDHNPVPRQKMANGIDLTFDRMHHNLPEFFKLRNKDIEEAVFACYHYRYISEEHAKNKLKTNSWYINRHSLQDIKSSTYPEIYDDTLSKKITR